MLVQGSLRDTNGCCVVGSIKDAASAMTVGAASARIGACCTESAAAAKKESRAVAARLFGFLIKSNFLHGSTPLRQLFRQQTGKGSACRRTA